MKFHRKNMFAMELHCNMFELIYPGMRESYYVGSVSPVIAIIDVYLSVGSVSPVLSAILLSQIPGNLMTDMRESKPSARHSESIANAVLLVEVAESKQFSFSTILPLSRSSQPNAKRKPDEKVITHLQGILQTLRDENTNTKRKPGWSVSKEITEGF
ncbi:hypothetical protein Tco_1275593 [Tanacetum coccineum]